MKTGVWLTLLWGAVMASALVQINVVQWQRDLLQVWQQEDAKRERLQQEYTRLLLEKGALTAHGRIDQVARKQLNMTEPEQVQVLPQ
ncbi:cell division protein FtsL [Thalassolituus sp. LLYu03]|uniref:cell division protein FtsL n=1 Tax=Thalassolituus sp. LLYu03 TaxID=3421656 RepID=UPI003D26BE47